MWMIKVVIISPHKKKFVIISVNTLAATNVESLNTHTNMRRYAQLLRF